jgi:hypothetical protein
VDVRVLYACRNHSSTSAGPSGAAGIACSFRIGVRVSQSIADQLGDGWAGHRPVSLIDIDGAVWSEPVAGSVLCHWGARRFSALLPKARSRTDGRWAD